MVTFSRSKQVVLEAQRRVRWLCRVRGAGRRRGGCRRRLGSRPAGRRSSLQAAGRGRRAGQPATRGPPAPECTLCRPRSATTKVHRLAGSDQLCWTPSSSSGFPRHRPWPPSRYLPVSLPSASGPHATTARSKASAMGSRSLSGVRSSMLYRDRSATNGVQPRSSAVRAGFRDLPGGPVGDTDVQHLSGTYQIIEGAHHLDDGRPRLTSVHPQQVDVFGAPGSAGWPRPTAPGSSGGCRPS